MHVFPDGSFSSFSFYFQNVRSSIVVESMATDGHCFFHSSTGGEILSQLGKVSFELLNELNLVVHYAVKDFVRRCTGGF